jgi:1,4-dihydroxy-6-naphthoate synthase
MEMKIFKMAMSPCPNDTFMFFHLLHRSELSRKYKIDLSICDIQELNQLCLNDEMDFCKISFSTAITKHREYVILRSGVATGTWCCRGLRRQEADGGD